MFVFLNNRGSFIILIYLAHVIAVTQINNYYTVIQTLVLKVKE